jgi:hypothetical protein
LAIAKPVADENDLLPSPLNLPIDAIVQSPPLETDNNNFGVMGPEFQNRDRVCVV